MSIQKRQEYSHKAFEIVVNHENDSLSRVNLFKVANRYYNTGDWKDYSQTVHLVLEKSKGAKDIINIAKAYTYLEDYYESQAALYSAFMFYYKAKKMDAKLGDNSNSGKILISKANLH